MPPKGAPGKPQATAGGKQPPKTTKAPKPARLTEVRAALKEVYHDTSKWNKCCLPLLGGILFGFAVTLIVLGIKYNIEDIIIIGAIFVGGSIIFFILLYINVIRPMHKRNQVTYERFNSRRDVIDEYNVSPMTDPLPDYGLYLDYNNEGFNYGEDRPVPSESQLYTSKKSRSFVTSPATATDVSVHEGTPPPPRVHSSLRRMASPPPKVAMPSESSKKKTPATFDMTIDEKMRQNALRESQDLELL